MDHPDKESHSIDRAKDTGMAFVLLALLGLMFTGQNGFLTAALVVLVVDMVYPKLFVLPSRLWFGGAEKIGFVVLRVLLLVTFFLVVTPVGLARRVQGWDPMKRRGWKKSSDSVFETVDHVYVPKDMAHPY